MIGSSKKIVIIGFSTTFCLILITLILNLLNLFPELHFLSILIAYLITTLNFGVGIFWVEKSLKSSEKGFVVTLLSGMGIRLFGILSLIIVCWKFLDINLINFIFSILFFYFFYLIVEILFINQRKIAG